MYINFVVYVHYTSSRNSESDMYYIYSNILHGKAKKNKNMRFEKAFSLCMIK